MPTDGGETNAAMSRLPVVDAVTAQTSTRYELRWPGELWAPADARLRKSDEPYVIWHRYAGENLALCGAEVGDPPDPQPPNRDVLTICMRNGCRPSIIEMDDI